MPWFSGCVGPDPRDLGVATFRSAHPGAAESSAAERTRRRETRSRAAHHPTSWPHPSFPIPSGACPGLHSVPDRSRAGSEREMSRLEACAQRFGFGACLLANLEWVPQTPKRTCVTLVPNLRRLERRVLNSPKSLLVAGQGWLAIHASSAAAIEVTASGSTWRRMAR